VPATELHPNTRQLTASKLRGDAAGWLISTTELPPGFDHDYFARRVD
jgi:hypothetical protein